VLDPVGLTGAAVVLGLSAIRASQLFAVWISRQTEPGSGSALRSTDG
jgi:hypothetical protein